MCLSLGLILSGAAGSGKRSKNLNVDADRRFHPIRIHMEFLDSLKPTESIRFVKEVAVGHVTQLVSRLVQVRDHANTPLSIDQVKCSYPNVPKRLLRKSGLENTDLVTFIDITTSCDADDSSTMMTAEVCQFDAIDRPQAGRVRICRDWLEEEWLKKSPNVIIETMLHEFIHLLGFHWRSLPKFRKFTNSGALEPRLPDAWKGIKVYTCELDSVTERPKVEWDVDPAEVGGKEDHTYFHTFLPGIIDALDARGLKASACRCPLDPGRTYTNEDIEYCIMHPNHCAVAIVTEKVVEKTREYFGCSSAKGMEIENGRSRPSCQLWFSDTHWKTRLSLGEIMNYQELTKFKFISPMTLAVLEDSGWYKVDYSVLAPPVPGLTWGHRKGCSFLLKKCVESRVKVLDQDAFCTLGNADEIKCSKDALTVQKCTGAKHIKTKHAIVTPDLPQYQYLAHEKIYWNNHPHFDYCPVFRDADISSCLENGGNLGGVPGPHSRCFMNKAGSPACLPTKCSPDGKSYTLRTESAALISCNEAGAEINGVVCQDPKIICANLNAFHLLPGTVLIPNAEI